MGNAKKILYFTFFILLNQHRPRKARAFPPPAVLPSPQKHAQLPVACASCCCCCFCCFSPVLAFLCIGCRAEQSRAGSGVGGAMSKIYLAHLQQEQQQQQQPQQWVQGVLVVAIVCSCHVPGLLLCGSVAVRFGWVRFAAPIV